MDGKSLNKTERQSITGRLFHISFVKQNWLSYSSNIKEVEFYFFSERLWDRLGMAGVKTDYLFSVVSECNNRRTIDMNSQTTF